MRKVLIVLLILIVTMSILWIVAGRRISEFVDQSTIAEGQSSSVHSISYQGTGEGGELEIRDPPGRLNLSLAPLNPHIGTDKENQLALANAGKVSRLVCWVLRTTTILPRKCQAAIPLSSNLITAVYPG